MELKLPAQITDRILAHELPQQGRGFQLHRTQNDGDPADEECGLRSTDAEYAEPPLEIYGRLELDKVFEAGQRSG